MSPVSSSAYSPLVEVVEQRHVPDVLDRDRDHQLVGHGVREQGADVTLGPRDPPRGDRLPHGAVGRVGAALGGERRRQHALGALEREGARLGVEQEQRAEVGVQERAAAGEHALHRLAVRERGVHLAPQHADVHELPVERLHADQVVLDALRDPLLVLRGEEHRDERADEVAELADLVAVEGVVARVVAAEPRARATDQVVDGPVHPEVEGHGDDGEQRQEHGGDLHDRRAVDDGDEEGERGGEPHGDDRRGLQLKADASLVAEASASLLLR